MIPVLAWDLSRSRAGFAASKSSDGTPFCGSRTFAYAGADPGEIGLSFKNTLVDMMKLIRPKIIAIEAPVLANVPQDQHDLEIKLGLLMLARVIAKPMGARVALGNVQTVRKYFTGSGRPGGTGKESKRIVFQRCLALGWKVANTDESDAAALWAWCCATNDKSFRLETGALLHRVDSRRVA